MRYPIYCHTDILDMYLFITIRKPILALLWELALMRLSVIKERLVWLGTAWTFWTFKEKITLICSR